ncbi:scavenger mRNA decapping enzyme [Mycena rebaudengoi]|nr:scavenger mRNA decapping enzyme [Mycena rebaudengoi]
MTATNTERDSDTELENSASTGGGNLPAIVRIEKTAIPVHVSQNLFPSKAGAFLRTVECMESTDIYTWMAGWLAETSRERQPQGDVKINIICPATDVHIRKYSEQKSILVRETPDIYRRIVEPYIREQSKILFPLLDFIILPDMNLYLVAIVRNKNIRSLRDLRADTGLERGGLRMYIHYQPSYYHFHVHIVNANYEAGTGMSVGQAHLLDDVISLLELDEENMKGSSTGQGIFERMTLTYGLGDQHGLYATMKAAQAGISSRRLIL